MQIYKEIKFKTNELRNKLWHSNFTFILLYLLLKKKYINMLMYLDLCP